MIRGIAILIFIAGILSTDRFDNRHWEMVTQIGLPEADEVPVYFVRVTPQMLGLSLAELKDLRIVDGQGKEVPYLVRKMEGNERVQRYFLKPIESTPENPLIYTVKIESTTVALINRIKLLCDGYFVATLVVSVSRDGVNWQEWYRGRVYRTPLRQPDGDAVERLSVVFPETAASFVRAQLEEVEKWGPDVGTGKPPILLGVVAEYIERTLPVYDTVSFLRVAIEDIENGGKKLDLSLPGEIKGDRIEISIAEPELDIDYQVHALWLQPTGKSKPGKLLASGRIERRHGIPENPFVIPLSRERLPRGMELILTPRAPTSLTITYLAVKTIETRIFFAGQRPKPYYIYLRNPHAKAPKYDDSDLTKLLRYPAEEATVLGMFAKNPHYTPVSPLVLSRPLRALLIVAGILALAGSILLWKKKVSHTIPETREISRRNIP